KRRTFVRSSASCLVKPDSEPDEIWTLPPGIAPWITGAEMTTLSSTIAKYWLMCAAVHAPNRSRPFGLRTKSTVRRPCWSEPTLALASSSPPNRTHGAVGCPDCGHGGELVMFRGDCAVGGVIE